MSRPVLTGRVCGFRPPTAAPSAAHSSNSTISGLLVGVIPPAAVCATVAVSAEHAPTRPPRRRAACLADVLTCGTLPCGLS